ncbi:hypothetical protein BDC45DRAFT_583432 [Circinella umbellata]|nr:hypothetical protein BDC45DRAFT_583432 [Circinella umbellata]
MYAKDAEEFDVKWNEFRQYYLVEDITFYTYMFDYYYPKREKWSKVWREGVQFHTNNLIESWHNQLKTHYLKRTRKHRIDYIVWVLTQVVDCAYRQSILQVFHGFEDVGLTKEEKKRHKTAYELDDDTATEYISAVDAQKIYVKSFTKENIYYEIVVREGVLHSCTCPDFYFNRILCKHIFLCNSVRDIPLHHVGISRSIQPVRPVNEADNEKIEEIRLQELRKNILSKITSSVDMLNCTLLNMTPDQLEEFPICTATLHFGEQSRLGVVISVDKNRHSRLSRSNQLKPKSFSKTDFLKPPFKSSAKRP